VIISDRCRRRRIVRKRNQKGGEEDEEENVRKNLRKIGRRYNIKVIP
jgi:hypothetical protein